MSNSRSFRRRLKASREAIASRPRRSRYPDAPPALGTVRGWLKQLEAEGRIERGPDRHTGKPGRPAHQWRAMPREDDVPEDGDHGR